MEYARREASMLVAGDERGVAGHAVSARQPFLFRQPPTQADVAAINNPGTVSPYHSKSASQVTPHLQTKSSLRLRLYGGLLLVDIICVVGGFLLANLLRFDDVFATQGVRYTIALLPVFLGLAFASGAYSLTALENPNAGLTRSLRSLAITGLAILTALFLAKLSAHVSRLTFLLGLGIAASAIAMGRLLFTRFARSIAKDGFVNELILVDRVAQLSPGRRHILVGTHHGLTARANDPASSQRLGSLLSGYDRVIVAAPDEDRVAWRETLRGTGVDIEILTPELDKLNGTILRRSEMGTSLLVAPSPLQLHHRITKRAFDVVVSLALFVPAAPILLVAAASVALTSPGPVLFRQSRLGKANRPFQVLKFRTMYSNDCDLDGARSTSRDDDRMTPVGRWLRRTSIDELPQLINVLKGEMSLVGPRPHAIASTANDTLFWDIHDRYWHRGAVKPGITGLAQVRGYRGATETADDLTNRVDSDLEYISNWSLWRDVSVLLQTVRVVFHANAF